IYDSGTTPADRALFEGVTPATTGPCLLEPELGSLLPKNWQRPRFRWVAAEGHNLFEIRVHADNQTQDLVVYTSVTAWIMPGDMWLALRDHSEDRPLEVTVRSGVKGSGALTDVGEVSGEITIAPVEAPGTIVYWTSGAGSVESALKGFKVGDEGVASVLTPADIPEANSGCIGCHISSPDGAYAITSLGSAQYGDMIAGIKADNLGQKPPFLKEGGRQALLLPQRGAAAVSPAHWQDGDHVIITSFNSAGKQGLSWVDLEAETLETATGLLAHDGEPPPPNWPTDFGQVAPSWSRSGENIAYVSAKSFVDGRVEGGPADIYVIPYNDRLGGTATALAGAADPDWTETYPSYSPDDAYVAFNRVAGITRPYAEPTMEIFLVPSAGGTPLRPVGNDPTACSGKVSPGVSNTWARWSPRSESHGDRTYYWLVFSSTRYTVVPQLFMSPIVVVGGEVTSYPALYFWNQPIDESNHTPAWDTFDIPPPPVTPPPVPPPPPPR
ncbi:MAG TPA: hypothetical protein VM686_01760, partial [Polyangiaceae bacterium]|nr:hypothetical protein [Polyangiaceae bacterium]